MISIVIDGLLEGDLIFWMGGWMEGWKQPIHSSNPPSFHPHQ
jgi:hypothetical protein